MDMFIIKYTVQRAVLTSSGELNPVSVPIHGQVELRKGLIAPRAVNLPGLADEIDCRLKELEA